MSTLWCRHIGSGGGQSSRTDEEHGVGRDQEAPGSRFDCSNKSRCRIPLTLHGGPGTDDDDLSKAISAGINIVHINTELRVAWRRGLEEALSKDINQLVPYKILPRAVELVRQVVSSRLQLFNNLPSNAADHAS